MKYIELPTDINTLEKNENGPFFFHKGQEFSLKDIEATAEGGYFQDKATGLKLSVTSSCPKLNKIYAEYQPGWCEITNGLQKAEKLEEMLSRQNRYTDTLFLSEEKLAQRASVLKKRKEDRYQKGPKSV